MGAVKDYYHDEICEGMELPRGDEPPTPFTKEWWEQQDKDLKWIKSQEEDNGNNSNR